MGWAIGYDENWRRDIGYGVPATCDQPGCNESINRGLSYVCGGQPFGGDEGCGLYFCWDHRVDEFCDPCRRKQDPYPAKPDTAEWVLHKLTDESWEEWRKEHPDWVKETLEQWFGKTPLTIGHD